jgi:endoglucanase
MKKILGIMLLSSMMVMAASASRVGPVSTYGKLRAASVGGKGRLVSSCPEDNNKAVQVRGMSLYWSSGADSATTYYTEKAVDMMVDEMKIEVIRFAMGLRDSWDVGRGYLGETGKALQLGYLKNIVNAAVDQDIYVIIDWHLEGSDPYESDAIAFFTQAAKDYGKYNNVIFEVFNEPKNTSQSAVTSYANKVIAAIRGAGADNLVLVGSNEWSSHPEECAKSGIQDSKNNFACSLHFYAGEHRIGGYDKRADEAIGLGVPVFASEWGTTNASGDGNVDEGSTNQWISWMSSNGVSWANWSASAIPQTTAAFTGITLGKELKYTQSGNLLKGILTQNVPTYKKCVENAGGGSSADGFSAGVANGASTELIDDMEDGDRYTYLGGWWSAFTDSDNDNDGRGSTSIGNGKWENDFGEQVYDVLMKSDGGKNTSKYMVGLKDIHISQGEYQYSPYATLGVNLKKDTSAVDLSACKSISYWYKGANHDFRVETVGVSEGQGNHANFHHVNKPESADWKFVELEWDQFTQESWGDDQYHFPLNEGMNKVRRMAWAVQGKEKVPDAANQPAFDFLYVDDVRCNGYTLKAITSGDGPVTSSSSTVANSSSSGVVKSSSSTVTQSSSSVEVKVHLVIDDMEDGDEVANTTGTWYAYNDSENGGLSKFSNAYDDSLGGYVVNMTGTADATNGTQGFVGISDISWNEGTYQYDPFVAIGLNMNADTSKGVDLSACSALSYRYKGATHEFKVQDGQVTNFAYHVKRSLGSAEWKEVIVTWDMLVQPSWNPDSLAVTLNKANIKKMAWEVIGYNGYPEILPDYDYLYIDDLKCLEGFVGIKAVARAASSIKLSVQGSALNVLAAKSGTMKVQVFDMMGNVVKSVSESVTSGMHQVSLEGMTRGNYVVRVMMGRDSKTARISLR